MDKRDLILVVDFGGVYTQLVARRIREARVYCEVVPYTVAVEEIREKRPKGLVLSGDLFSVHDESSLWCDLAVLQGIPVLGIGGGMQLLAQMMGGKVSRGEKRECKAVQLTLLRHDLIFKGLPEEIPVRMGQGDIVETLSTGFSVAAAAPGTTTAAFFDENRRFFGVRFHPEAEGNYGKQILRNFLYDICGCHGDWTPAAFIKEEISAIKKTVGSSRVIGALSGGVDSSVAAVLTHRAIGEQLTCIFVDHGLLRKGEREQVTQLLIKHLGVKMIIVDARERFMAKLSGVADPEKKRKIIGHEFIRVFEEETAHLGKFDFLLQGTIYPDVIESGTATTGTVKSHHNVGGLPKDMKLRLLEPLRLLFKDEVRLIGQELGLSHEAVWRQPFPGPGLAVRVLGELSEEKLALVREADYILREEIRRSGLEQEIWQYFAALLPVRSVGMSGGERTYAHPIVIRAVTSEDAMTADWARLPLELLERIADRILSEVPGINRVLYDLTPKPPGTIEWE